MTVPGVYHFDFRASLPLTTADPDAVAIYVLIDPAEPAVVRYVGKTTRPRLRLNSHCHDGLQRRSTYCANWVASVIGAGRRPEMRVVMWVVADEWEPAERAAILAARALYGDRLTNESLGGEPGPADRRQPDAQRAAISAALKGRKHSPAHIEAVRRAQLGKTISPEVRAKLSAAHKGKPYTEAQRAAHAAKNYVPSPQTRAAISAARMGHPVSAETRERIAATKRGKPRSAETRAKISATLKERGITVVRRTRPTAGSALQLPLPFNEH